MHEIAGIDGDGPVRFGPSVVVAALPVVNEACAGRACVGEKQLAVKVLKLGAEFQIIGNRDANPRPFRFNEFVYLPGKMFVGSVFSQLDENYKVV